MSFEGADPGQSRVIVLDSAALIAGSESLLALGGIVDPSTETTIAPLSEDERVTFYTTPDVVQEVRDARARAKLNLLDGFLTVRAPSSEALSKVTKFARATGDYSVLSLTDLRVIALCWMLEVERGGISRLRDQPMKVSSGQIRIGSLVPFEEVERAEREMQLQIESEQANDCGWVTVSNSNPAMRNSTTTSSQRQRRPRGSKIRGLPQSEERSRINSRHAENNGCALIDTPKPTTSNSAMSCSRYRCRPKSSKNRVSQSQENFGVDTQQAENSVETPELSRSEEKLSADPPRAEDSLEIHEIHCGEGHARVTLRAEDNDGILPAVSEPTIKESTLPSSRRRRRSKSTKGHEPSQSEVQLQPVPQQAEDSPKIHGLSQEESLQTDPQQAEGSGRVLTEVCNPTMNDFGVPSTRRRRRPKNSKNREIPLSGERSETDNPHPKKTSHISSNATSSKASDLPNTNNLSLNNYCRTLDFKEPVTFLRPDSTGLEEIESSSSILRKDAGGTNGAWSLSPSHTKSKLCVPTDQSYDPTSVLDGSKKLGEESDKDRSENPVITDEPREKISHENTNVEDDGVGWINQENVDQHLAQDSLEAAQTAEDEDRVGCVTTDFAMQNTMLQMGLKVLTVDGRRAIRSIRHFALRCHACGSVTRDLEKKFCDRCGNFTMHRVAFNVDKEGVARAYLNPKKGPQLRGSKYSIPMPRGGRHSKDLILRADQIDSVQQRRIEKRLERMNVDVLDPGTMYNAGASFRPHERPIVIGHGRRNPNEVRRTRKKR